MRETELREAVCMLGKSLFDRGYTHGATGNISVRFDDSLIVSPADSCLGRLDPATLTKIGADGRVVSGAKPTKEMPLHTALYKTRTGAGAIVHLHSCHSVAWSMLPGIDPENVFPPLTAYSLMRVGRAALVPYFRPGDPAIAEVIKNLGGRYGSVLLANHGPVVAGTTLESAVNAVEELEQTARLGLLLRHETPNILTLAQQKEVQSDIR